MMRKFFKIAGLIIAVIILIAAGGILYLNQGLRAGKDMGIEGLRITNLSDGIYPGEYKAGRWSNKVMVTIEGGRIESIRITDDVTFADPGLSDEVFRKVIYAQDTKTDVVSGATVTSMAYLKSIENALNGK